MEVIAGEDRKRGALGEIRRTSEQQIRTGAVDKHKRVAEETSRRCAVKDILSS